MTSILAVDDSASMRQFVGYTLGNAGFTVVQAVDGEDALDKARRGSFQLVLTDQHMPRLDGIGLTQRLREDPRYQDTPILVLTADTSADIRQRGRIAGATGWLLKPFDPAKLVEVITKLII